MIAGEYCKSTVEMILTVHSIREGFQVYDFLAGRRNNVGILLRKCRKLLTIHQAIGRDASNLS